MEEFTRWEPVPDIVAPSATIDVHATPDSFQLLVRFSRLRGGHGGDLRLTFGPNVLAFTSYDEFAHPWNGYETGALPMLPAPWERYPYPLLVVHGSPWFDATVDGEVQQREWYTHYRLVSLDHTVDVLTSGQVEADWIAPTAAG